MTSDKCYENKKMSKSHVEDDPMGGFDPYSASKGATELITSAYRNSFFKNNSNLSNIATARVGNVIGGGDWADDRIIPDLIKGIIKNKNPVLRNPNSKRPWQYVLEPLSSILWLAAKMYQEPTKFDEAWNFGPTSSSLTVRELANAILKEWDTNLMCEIQNNSDDMPESDILLLDSSKAEKNLGWKNILSIEETIFETVSWYKKNKNDMEEIKQFSLNQIENYVTKAKQRNTIWA
jgi:CDP-glucose 4,6-dehydratase